MVEHGGKRTGSGAPKKEEVATNRSMKFIDSDWLKIKSLGGAKWIRGILRELEKRK